MIDPKDRKFYLEIPDADFNPQRNKFLVEEAIRKTDEYKRLQRKAHIDNIRERSSAVADYLTTARGGASSGVSVEKYFGKQTLAYLRGEDIANKLRQKSSLILP